MHIVKIAPDANVPAVTALLQDIGRIWRPSEEVPDLIYIDGVSDDEIARVPGIGSLCNCRAGRLALALYELAQEPPPRPLTIELD